MTPKEAAHWLLAEVRANGELYQYEAASHLENETGKDLTYINDNGNVAIAPSVLSEFRKLAPDEVVWERSERLWRLREEYDEPGRNQP